MLIETHRDGATLTTTPRPQVNDFDTSDAQWRNATITHVEISPERGIAIPSVTLDGSGWGVNFGGVVWGPGADAWLRGVMACAGVDSWSKMIGRNVRALVGGCGSSITVIAHITDDEIVDQRAAVLAAWRKCDPIGYERAMRPGLIGLFSHAEGCAS